MSEQPGTPIDWRVESERFDGVADLYDRYRPSYPAELVEDILHISNIQPDGEILEIGSGTGKATILFAQRGFAMLCLEPGGNLIEVAQRNLAAYPKVSFVRSRFEDWTNDHRLFDLVISAQAYHWVPEELRYEKTASVMKPGGYLAAFWNLYPGMEGKIRQELDQVYSKRAPELVKEEVPFEQVIKSRAGSLYESPYFDRVDLKQYSWSEHYTTKEYLGLLNTYSDHLRLPGSQREALLGGIAEVIEKNGGFIERPYHSVLFLAQKSNEII